ncbi:sphere organelles protein-like protein isoform X2 [Carex rostrata]
MRIQVVFDEGRLLSKEQQWLRRCWFSIKPEMATVADLASDLFRRFHLQRSCPDGIILKMDGAVIPPFESTSFFRKKDIVRVLKRTCKKKELITRGDDMEQIHRGEIVEKETVPFSNGMLIESRESIEMRIMNSGLTTHLDEMGSKRKHKEIEESYSSKKKKPKLTTIQKPLVINGISYKETEEEPNQQSFQRARTPEQILHEKANPSDVDEASPMVVLATDNANVSNDTSQIIPERNKQLEENCNTNTCKPDSGNLTKKFPSRSARRRYAQRLIKKEMKKQAAEKMQNAVLLNGTNELATENHVAPAQEPIVTSNSVVARVDRPGHIRFESEGEDDDDDDAGPSNVQLKEPPMKSFQWNGIANKVMGQKWGQGFYKHNASRYNSASSNWLDATNEDSFTNEKVTEKITSDKGKAIIEELNFESLPPLTRSPKEGDLIVYRVVELSSTWCPDLSPFRVGEVKVYDLMSNRIILAPLPEYPIFPDNEGDDANEGEEDAPYQDNLSLYKEDGSLEIEFASLVDVRLLRVNGSVSQSASSVSRKTNSNRAAMKKDKFIVNRSEMELGNSAVDVVEPTRTHGSQDVEKNLFSNNNRDFAVQNDAEEPILEPTGTEPNSNWELANGGNTQSHENGWGTWAPNTSTPSWSYRALRGSALGPTVALLRGNNGNANSGDSDAIRYGGGRGRGRGRGRRGRGRGNYGMQS